MSQYTPVRDITGKEAPPNFLSKGIYDQFRVPKDPAWNCLSCRSCVIPWVALASQRPLPTYFWATELSIRSQNGKGACLLLKLSLELMLPHPYFKMKYMKGKYWLNSFPVFRLTGEFYWTHRQIVILVTISGNTYMTLTCVWSKRSLIRVACSVERGLCLCHRSAHKWQWLSVEQDAIVP